MGATPDSGLNPEQSQAVEHEAGPLMVLAGAGSGKTRVLVHRIANLVRRGTKPHRILAVTFTNKAAGEMRDRVAQMLGLAAQHMWISTFHSTCARLLRLYHEDAGLSRDFTIYDDDDQLKLINGILKEEGLADSITPRAALTLIDRAKNRGEDPMAVFSGTFSDDIIQQVYPRYQSRLAQEHAVDFNDLLLKVLELFDTPVGDNISDMFDHVLVDEFQDTNLVQYRLVRHFVKKTRNLTVVGDDDQSIYSWRGAEPRNLLDFERDFRDATPVKLEQNYRSTQVILEAANAVISHNLDRHDKALWTERAGGEPVLWEETADERSEADFVASAIHGLVGEENREFGDMAILYRTHAQSRVLEEILRANRIDYRIVGGVSFFQRREVKDIRAYLRLIINPAADLAFERVVNVPTRGVGKTTVDRMRAFARSHGLGLLDAARATVRGEIATIKGAARKKVGAFVRIVDGLSDVNKAGASVAELIIQVVERSSYRERLEQEDSPESRDRLQNLSELVSMASDFDDETDGEGSLVDFDERISLASSNDQADGRGSSVTMMTIHAAKGLEFPVVFVCGMEDGLFPSMREREVDVAKALEEERRLAYVAFTRPMERLVLTSARTRRHWSEIRLNRPSRFLDEIPSECLAVRERPGRAPAVYDDHDTGSQRPQRRQTRGGARGTPTYSSDEFDQREYYDDVPEFDIGGDVDGTPNVGSRVRHSSFGTGRVIDRSGSGKDLKLVINFSTVGRKTILARFVQPE